MSIQTKIVNLSAPYTEETTRLIQQKQISI